MRRDGEFREGRERRRRVSRREIATIIKFFQYTFFCDRRLRQFLVKSDGLRLFHASLCILDITSYFLWLKQCNVDWSYKGPEYFIPMKILSVHKTHYLLKEHFARFKLSSSPCYQNWIYIVCDLTFQNIVSIQTS